MEKAEETEHRCRLRTPNYNKYPRVNCNQKHDRKCIDVVYGLKGPSESEIQALAYPPDEWTESTARSHCESREGKFDAWKKAKKESVFQGVLLKQGDGDRGEYAFVLGLRHPHWGLGDPRK